MVKYAAYAHLLLRNGGQRGAAGDTTRDHGCGRPALLGLHRWRPASFLDCRSLNRGQRPWGLSSRTAPPFLGRGLSSSFHVQRGLGLAGLRGLRGGCFHGGLGERFFGRSLGGGLLGTVLLPFGAGLWSADRFTTLQGGKGEMLYTVTDKSDTALSCYLILFHPLFSPPSPHLPRGCCSVLLLQWRCHILVIHKSEVASAHRDDSSVFYQRLLNNGLFV